MGCQCSKPTLQDNEEIQENIILVNEAEQRNNKKYDSYPEKMVELINKIRQNPQEYANIIDNSIVNIVDNENLSNNDDANSNIPKAKIIYKNKVKVALARGVSAFKEAASQLRKMSPLSPLQFKKEICVPLPENEEQLNNSSYLKEQVRLVREKYQINVFFKDMIKIPEVSGLLMIVDDNVKNAGKKRKAVLNPDFKYIGIASKFIGKTFVAYYSFSK